VLSLEEGVNEVRFTDVASQIDPTSVHFRSLTDPQGTQVLEQNYEYDIVGSQKLLRKYVDREITLLTDDRSQHQGTLLSGEGDIILADERGKITVVKQDSVREFVFPALPEGLITRPTLVWLLDSESEGDNQVEVTYLTDGVNWRADYITAIDPTDEQMDLTGWVTINNQSGATYKDAQLKLIAGDVRRVTEPGVVREKMMFEAAPRAAAPQFEERAFFEYHLYTLQRPTTVRDQQTKQIEFVSANQIPLEKIFVYDGAAQGPVFFREPLTDQAYGTPTNTKVNVLLEFTNTVTNNLGLPLPKGIIRVYKEDVDGSSQFIGEDQIDHTPKDEMIRLYVGDAFDVVGERVQTDFKRPAEKVIEETYKITVRNHKEEAITVRVIEHLFRWSQWEIVEASHDYEKLDAQTIEFRLPVRADGEATITYTVRYSWQ